MLQVVLTYCEPAGWNLGVYDANKSATLPCRVELINRWGSKNVCRYDRNCLVMDRVGTAEGADEAATEGLGLLVGAGKGSRLGFLEGILLGFDEGRSEGRPEGLPLGVTVNCPETQSQVDDETRHKMKTPKTHSLDSTRTGLFRRPCCRLHVLLSQLICRMPCTRRISSLSSQWLI